MLINGRQIAGVIFDIDGTLVDSFPVFSSVFNKVMMPYLSVSVPHEFLGDCLNKGLDLGEIVRRVSPMHAEAPFVEERRKEIMELFLKMEAEEIKLLPGVTELFKRLKERDLKIGIATGRTSPPEREWYRFKRFGLDRFIDSLVTSREVERRKPAPDALVECAKRLKVPIQKCLAVGDTEIDVVAAREAGAIPVAVTTGHDGRAALEKEKPELIFDNLNEFSFFLFDREGKGKNLS